MKNIRRRIQYFISFEAFNGNKNIGHGQFAIRTYSNNGIEIGKLHSRASKHAENFKSFNSKSTVIITCISKL